jgi:hypothetical protein
MISLLLEENKLILKELDNLKELIEQLVSVNNVNYKSNQIVEVNMKKTTNRKQK